jgi:CMP-N,N'-diacetyllegionaminic acid synthase
MLLGLIPARAGSKGLPGKNGLEMAGQTLIARAAATARACSRLDRTIISTDSPEFARLAVEAGVEAPFMRPSELAADDAPTMPVIQHAVAFCENEYSEAVTAVVLLDPTAALRTVADLDGAIDLFFEGDGCDAVVSGSEARRHPAFTIVTGTTEGIRLLDPQDKEVTRRQDLPPTWDLDANVWIYGRKAIEEGTRLPEHTRLYETPRLRSWDIDTRDDLSIMECLMRVGGLDE